MHPFFCSLFNVFYCEYLWIKYKKQVLFIKLLTKNLNDLRIFFFFWISRRLSKPFLGLPFFTLPKCSGFIFVSLKSLNMIFGCFVFMLFRLIMILKLPQIHNILMFLGGKRIFINFLLYWIRGSFLFIIFLWITFPKSCYSSLFGLRFAGSAEYLFTSIAFFFGFSIFLLKN